MIAEKALIAQINYGFTSLEGLCHPTNGYGIAVPQICNLFQFDKNQGSRTVKRVMGKDFQFDQWHTTLNPKAVNVVQLSSFAMLTYQLAKKGNEIADSFVLAAIEETHERRFDLAFGAKVDEEEYNERLKLRMKRLSARHDWTDTLMNRYVDLFGEKPNRHHYKIWTKEVNLALFNRPNFNSDRDNMTPEQQELIADFERTAKRIASKYPQDTPNAIIQRTLDTF